MPMIMTPQPTPNPYSERGGEALSSSLHMRHLREVAGALSTERGYGEMGARRLTGAHFTDHLYAKGMIQTTVRDFDRAVGQVQRWLHERGWTLDDVPGPVLTQFTDTLPHTYATRRRFQLAVAHYWEMTGRLDAPLGAIPVPRQPKARCRALSEAHAKRLAAVAKGWADGPEGLAVLFGLYLALRRMETAKIRWEDFDDGELTILGKGHSVAVLPVHPAILPQLEMQRVRSGNTPWVFPGRDGLRPVCRTTINTWVDRVAAVAGVVCTTHQLRHTCLATMNDNTGDLRAVMTYARHARPTTTLIYTRTTKRRLVELGHALDY